MSDEGLHDEFLGGLEAYASSVWDKVQNQSDKSLMLGLAQAGGFRRPPRYVPPEPPLPRGPFKIVLSDPPWSGVGAESHYDTLTIPQMAQWPVKDLNHPDGTVHFMWVVSCLMEPSMALLRAWGYEYKTVAFIWKKTKNGKEYTGRPKPYTQSGVEMVLLGRTPHRKPDIADRHVMQIVEAEWKGHSVKPPEVHDRIVRLLKDNQPRLEMFARRTPANVGWEIWGNQAPNTTGQTTAATNQANRTLSKGSPHLVPLPSRPPRIRRSVYTDMLHEFVEKRWKYAKIANAPSSAIVSVKNAIKRSQATDVVASTVNGEVVLERMARKGLKTDPEVDEYYNTHGYPKAALVVPKRKKADAPSDAEAVSEAPIQPEPFAEDLPDE